MRIFCWCYENILLMLWEYSADVMRIFCWHKHKHFRFLFPVPFWYNLSAPSLFPNNGNSFHWSPTRLFSNVSNLIAFFTTLTSLLALSSSNHYFILLYSCSHLFLLYSSTSFFSTLPTPSSLPPSFPLLVSIPLITYVFSTPLPTSSLLFYHVCDFHHCSHLKSPERQSATVGILTYLVRATRRAHFKIWLSTH